MAESSREADERSWYAVLATLGFEMVAPIGLGVFLDVQFDTRPWCSLGGVFLGFFGGMAHLILTLNAINKKIDRHDRGRT